MQIDRYNHSLFSRDPNATNNPAAGKGASLPTAAGAAGVLTQSQPGTPAPVVAGATRRPEGIVLNIQWSDRDTANSPDPGVYTN